MATARPRRLQAAFLLAMYVACTGAALWAESQLDAAGATPTHVEETGQHPCDIGHHHGHCLVCRTLCQLGLPMRGPVPDTLIPRRPTGSFVAAADLPTPPHLRLPSSRAPPALARSA